MWGACLAPHGVGLKCDRAHHERRKCEGISGAAREHGRVPVRVVHGVLLYCALPACQRMAHISMLAYTHTHTHTRAHRYGNVDVADSPSEQPRLEAAVRQRPLLQVA